MAQFQGLAASTQGGVPSVPGKIPGGMTSCPTPVGQKAGVVSLISFVYTRSDRCFVYNMGGGESLFTPAALGRRAFRRPEHARLAITTALA